MLSTKITNRGVNERSLAYWSTSRAYLSPLLDIHIVFKEQVGISKIIILRVPFTFDNYHSSPFHKGTKTNHAVHPLEAITLSGHERLCYPGSSRTLNLT